MRPAYDYQGARRLIPLLRAIHREIRERSDGVRRTAIRIRVLAGERSPHDPATRRRRIGAHRGEIANHQREIRQAQGELARLGCLVDGSRPGRVLIPGADGALSSGYAWNIGDTRVYLLEPERA